MKLDIDIYLKQGQFLLDTQIRCFESALGVFGPSGCGKSTLFRAIAGLVRPHGGHIILDDEPLFDAERHLFVPPHKRGIGLVFQDARLFPHWSVEKNLRTGEFNKERLASRPFSFDDIVDLLQLQPLISRSIEQLSGGEKQRVAIGRTLLAHPRLLLMDEPVTGLDNSLKAQILPFLAEIQQALKLPTILISHDLGEILQLTHHLVLLRNGAVVGQDTLENLVKNPQTLDELKGSDLTNILSTRIHAHDQTQRATSLKLEHSSEHFIHMEMLPDLAVGQKINIGIAANQIALADRKMVGISMKNQLPGTVDQIIHTNDRSLCCLSTPAGTLFAEIAPATEGGLDLSVGIPIWALFKSRAIQQLGIYHAAP